MQPYVRSLKCNPSGDGIVAKSSQMREHGRCELHVLDNNIDRRIPQPRRLAAHDFSLEISRLD